MSEKKETTAAQMRKWQGPAIFSYGFRPFFFFGAVQAAVAVGLFVPWYFGAISVPSLFPAQAWHSHSLLFGYAPAIFAGFLTTAVPNWTGRFPVVGWRLIGLFSIWLAGRCAILFSDVLGAGLTAAIDLSFLVALIATIGREIIGSKNWRNLPVIAGLVVVLAANGGFHWQIWNDGQAEFSERLAIAGTIGLIMLIGGRVVPSFTTNWIKRVNPGPVPVPLNRFDRLVIMTSILALIGWIASSLFDIPALLTGTVLMIAGAANLARQIRWMPHRVFGDMLVLVLHIAYFFVSLGFLLTGMAILSDGDIAPAAGIHTWTTGAIGTMTLAMMTRASLGHTGQALTATKGTIAIFAFVISAACLRVMSALIDDGTILLQLAGLAWIAAFVGFAVFYGPLIFKPKP